VNPALGDLFFTRWGRDLIEANAALEHVFFTRWGRGRMEVISSCRL